MFTSFIELDVDNITEDDFAMMIVGEEICPETSKVHWHGVFRSHKRINLNKLQETLAKDLDNAHTIHVEQVLDVKAAIKYCRKDGKVILDWGEPPITQGKRSDLDQIGEEIISGSTLVETAMQHPGKFIQYSKGFEKLTQLIACQKKKDYRPVACHIYWGDTGTGKTRKAISDAQGDYYMLPVPGANGMIWFDGYQGEGTLIIDDFYGKIPIDEFLRITDCHPYAAQVKGGYVQAKWNKVVITSNKDPNTWRFGTTSEQKKAFARRCPQVNWIHFKDLEDDVVVMETPKSPMEPPPVADVLKKFDL